MLREKKRYSDTHSQLKNALCPTAKARRSCPAKQEFAARCQRKLHLLFNISSLISSPASSFALFSSLFWRHSMLMPHAPLLFCVSFLPSHVFHMFCGVASPKTRSQGGGSRSSSWCSWFFAVVWFISSSSHITPLTLSILNRYSNSSWTTIQRSRIQSLSHVWSVHMLSWSRRNSAHLSLLPTPRARSLAQDVSRRLTEEAESRKKLTIDFAQQVLPLISAPTFSSTRLDFPLTHA